MHKGHCCAALDLFLPSPICRRHLAPRPSRPPRAGGSAAAVETFEVQPEQCLVELTLRLQAAAAGRVDVLESALVQLLDAL